MTTLDAPVARISDSRFAALKAKLRELFELDKSDLDFGIYRIINARNTEITEFLDRQLKDVVRDTLNEHGEDATKQIQAELEKTIEGLRNAGLDDQAIEGAKKVQELRAKLASAGGTAAEGLEADIYNHLLAFFSRYYDEGDFISKRRYKGDTYAIPYSGEEVVLHWANKDQYYIKSGEWHKDYRFKVADTEARRHGGAQRWHRRSPVKTVHFKLVEATQEGGGGNNKEPDEAKRRYIIDFNNPIEISERELVIRFHFRAPTEEEKHKAADNCVAIFGGKYAKSTKGDEREQFCALAEKVVLEALTSRDREGAAWLKHITQSAPTEAKPKRTILGKHLDHFTARNTFDYFIHKDLGGFLRRELDFYIKNEVVRLDDLETLPPDHLRKVQGRVKAIRRVAGRIIDLLASIEDFQKKMWLKKKLVLETNWLVTIDRIPDRLRDVVAANEAQWKQWEALGFRPEADDAGELFEDPVWGTREYLDAHPNLVVDTALFPDEFKATLLASEEILGGKPSLDEATTGVLIHSENFQALNLLQERYREQIKCVYIDPPYNTNDATFVYKNMYRHSSWAAMLLSRLQPTTQVMTRDGCLQLAIDDAEYHRAKAIVDEVFGEENFLGTLAIQTNPRGRGINSHYATSHDYIICTSVCQAAVEIVDQPLTEEQAAGYSGGDEESAYRLLPFRRSGGLSTPVDRPNSEFSMFIDAATNSVIGVGGPRENPYPARYTSSVALMLGDHGTIETIDYSGALARPNVIEIMPIDSEGARRVWRWSDRVKILQHAAKGDFVVRANQGQHSILLKDRIKDGRKPKTLWFESKYDASSHGTNLIKDLLGSRGDFVYPKSLYNTYDAVHSVVGNDEQAIIIDYFAGSGTTGHAVINLNREDGGDRKFILVEMGAYFHTVLEPRIAKVIYSPDWKDGKAQSHDKPLPGGALVKYFALESYEDALNNLPVGGGSNQDEQNLLAGLEPEARDAWITYALDLELGPHLLNLDAFRDPWGYTINAQLAGEDEIKPHRVDLIETFNYLVGLKVKSYGPIERYSAEFERAEHDLDAQRLQEIPPFGRLQLTGRLRRDPEGPFVFQRIEGVLNDGQDTRVLIIWRKLTDDPEQDAAVLEAWMERHRENTKERNAFRDYQVIYINGPVTLPQPTQEIRTVYPIEEAFKVRMFEDADTEGAIGIGGR